ncbi:MAG: lamin tail protein [Myxococcaceae bacterium]|nr:lamin tail protein [Myxococcaceae bacterium]
MQPSQSTPWSTPPLLHGLLLLVLLSSLACSANSGAAGLGELELGLTTQAGDITYRLSNARFALDGPEKREFGADDQDELQLELAAGAYRLTLQDGFQLRQKDLPESAPIAARLVSQNPSPVLITAGETSRATLRFELDSDASVTLGPGTLQVGIEIGASDAGTLAASSCVLGLRIDELDYEQASSDDTEFIELVNTGRCNAPLEGVVLELVNGGDGKVYAHYALQDVSPSLAPGERLVLGDEKVLAALPSAVKRAMLSGSGLQNGPDGVRIVRAGRLIDAVAYEDKVMGSGEGAAAPADEAEQSLSRCPDGFDTDDNALDFQLTRPTPGTVSVCP